MSERIRKPIRTGIIAAVVAFSVIAGTMGSYAYWAANGTATLGTTAATLTSTTAGWTATTLGNEDVASAGSVSLTSTGSITFTNTTNTTSSQSQTLTATFSRASGDTSLAGATTLTAWYVTSSALCTAAAGPVSPVSGSWAAGVVVTRSLAPGASATYCLRNTVANRQGIADSDGTRSFVPQAVAQLSIGNFTANQTVTSTISSQYVFTMQSIVSNEWNFIKRAGTTWCWDVSGSGTTSGSLLISYECKPIGTADLNQDFRYTDPDGDGYGSFQAAHAAGIRVAAAASGSAVTMITTDAAAATQQWQPQVVSSSPLTYQFVNKYSGLCLSMPATSTGAATQVTCSGGADQRFTLTYRAPVSLACVPTGTGETRTAQFSWTADSAGGPYVLQAHQTSGSPWVDLTTTPGTSVNAPVAGQLSTWGNGTYGVRVVNGTGQVVGTDTITVASAYQWFVIFDYFYARC